MDIIRIAIVGGGIGGMAAALALQRSGQQVVVYERSPQFREIGAGLIITANARRALQALGVDEALAAISSCEPLHHTCNYATGEVLRTL
ncbi:MAG: NAD(P)-binding protein, partial [Burkholderiaceae bacterium]|nr:NAD(P)-binding protein [Burkholderiaceae bacterium]